MTQDLPSEFPGLLDHEKQVWQALVDGDAGADRNLLLPEFIGVYPSGISGRAGHVSQLADGPSIREFKLSEIHAFVVGADHAMLCYRADYQRAGAAGREAMFVSSLWQRGGGGWCNLFSQDTPLDPPHCG
jgi:hypothetical protein